jgi:transcriptional regulator with GAF, ATPase, and Fis domain
MPGSFELGSGGTIFPDEVGELPAETQITLLRVLQKREFERVGGTRAIRTDVSAIAVVLCIGPANSGACQKADGIALPTAF